MDIKLLEDIDIQINYKLLNYLHVFKLNRNILKEYIILLKLDKVEGLQNRQVITELLFPEIYQDFKDKIGENKIIELIYDKGIYNLIHYPLKSIDNYENNRDIYDNESDTWKKIDLIYLKNEILKYFIGIGEEPYYNYNNIKSILYKIIIDYVERQYINDKKNELLLDSFEEDKLYREYISDILGISINEISKTWTSYKPDKWNKNHLNMTNVGKLGIVPTFIRDYLNTIDKQNENMIYLRYGSIGDGDCLFHSYLDMTSQEYLLEDNNSKKQEITNHFRKWLSDNVELFDYNYLNPQLSYFLLESDDSDEVSFQAYKKHLKNCSEYGYDLDFVYLMNIIDYKKISLIQDIKQKLKDSGNSNKLKKEIQEIRKDKKYNSYNIFLFSYDLNRININNYKDKQEFGKQFLQLLPHYNYQSNRNSILLFNVGGMHFEGIIRIPLPKNKLTFTQWKYKINSSIKYIQKSKKINTLFNKYFDKNYLIDYLYPKYNYSATQYTNKENIIQHLLTYIKSSGENTESWESHPIRNWKDNIYYLCEKGEFARNKGFRIPNNRGVCPIKHPWRFKMGKSDNFCCSISKKIAKQKIESTETDNNYKDALNNELPILQKLTNKNIFNKTKTNQTKKKKKYQ